MKSVYWKKSYTQGYTRELIKIKHSLWLSPKQIQQELHIGSISTVYKRIKRNSLQDLPSSPKQPHRKYSLKELYYLYAYKKYLNLPLDELVDELASIDINIPRSSASYYLNQWKLTKHFKPKKQFSSFKDYDVGYLHVDITYWPKINWVKHYIYVAIDRKTRLIYLEVHDNKKAHTAANFFRNAIDFFPFQIEYVLTDNGKEFTLKNHKWKYDLQGVFDKVCEEFDIEHRLTLPAHPWTNWMVEKANDTIKSLTVRKKQYTSSKEMKEDIQRSMVYYNLKRRHSWIYIQIRKGTPFEALEYYYNLSPDKFKEPPDKFKEKLINYL